MKHELLVPCGDMASLYQAVANGADAIYIGLKNFSARKFAQNFTNEEIISVIKYCHLYGVKVYVTMNTLIKDHEVTAFLKQVEFLHENGVDAILIQDFGMLCLVREIYPNLEIHASTQANIASKDTVEFFYHLGVKRVVFAREMSLEEIEAIDVPIEKEVFIHGALCVCYSGCCLMSSMIGKRSGNRGECAGSCRLPYSLEYQGTTIVNNKYLLSTKELNTAVWFQKLLDSNITSFKIEGRMKSPEYVGFITKFYRNIIDGKWDLSKIKLETDKLKTIFHRGFTTGHLFNRSEKDIMNSETPNHIGLEIGRVIHITPQKIKIKLTQPLNQQDGIRFLKSGKGFIVNYLYDAHGKLVNHATDVCYVDNKVKLQEYDIVTKTMDYRLLNQLKIPLAKKVPIKIEVIAKREQPLLIKISDENHMLEVQGNVVQSSKNAPISSERIQKQIEKLGTTPFFSKCTKIIADNNIFIPMKEINDLRHAIIEQLMLLRMEEKRLIIKKEPKFLEKLSSSQIIPGLSVSVNNEEQLKVCQKFNLKRIYLTQKPLYEKYKSSKNIYYKLPRCSRIPIKNSESKSLTSDYFDFSRISDLIGDYGQNITNIYTIYYLKKYGLKTATLSVELTAVEMEEIIDNYYKNFHHYPDVEIVGYGRIENMIIKGNILNLKTNNSNYKLRDQRNRKFPVYFDGVNTHVLNYCPYELQRKEKLKKYCDIRLEFFQETPNEIKEILEKY